MREKIYDIRKGGDDSLIVIKKDSTREQYDRSKIEAGVLRACYKRAISAEEMNHAIDCIETEIFNREEREIESKVIGEIVMDRLKELMRLPT